MYRITATVHRNGGLPTTWMRLSPKEMTPADCEKLLHLPLKHSKVRADRVRITDFKCEKE